MSGIDAIRSYFVKFEWKPGKHLTGQDVKENRALPHPEHHKPPVDVLSGTKFYNTKRGKYNERVITDFITY